ncbi:MAG: LysR family transcriptional regulator [Acetobacteraceae bacterium]|nr:LysR family transcriptional regulator [Acetobacteraceae bacterium]
MSTKNVPTELLRAFVTLAEMQNFTRAGTVLSRTQAAVSMLIRRLEEQIGSALFERGKSGTSLTDEGRFLLSYAKRILQLNDELLGSLELGRASQLIRFGAPDDYATVLLPKVLRIFSETFPTTQIEIVCANSADLLQDMTQQHLDLVLAVARPLPITKDFTSRQPVFWVSAADDNAHPRDPLPLALFPHGCACRDLALEALTAAGRRWNVVVTSSTNSAILGAVMAGMAVTVMETCLIGPGLRRLGLEDGVPPLGEVRSPCIVSQVQRKRSARSPSTCGLPFSQVVTLAS